MTKYCNQEEMNSSKDKYITMDDWKPFESPEDIEETQRCEKKRDLLALLQQLQVKQKYLDIQIKKQYTFEEIEKLSQEQFATKFEAENSLELNDLAGIQLKLKGFNFLESYEVHRSISISVSADNQREIKARSFKPKISANTLFPPKPIEEMRSRQVYNPKQSHIQSTKKDGFLGNFSLFNNFDANIQSEYIYTEGNEDKVTNSSRYNLANSIKLTHSTNTSSQDLQNINNNNNNITPYYLHPNYKTKEKLDHLKVQHKRNQTTSDQKILFSFEQNLTETVFYNLKQLPYDPFDYSSANFLSNSSQSTCLPIQIGKGDGSQRTCNTVRSIEQFIGTNSQNLASLKGIETFLNQVSESTIGKSSQRKQKNQLDYQKLLQPHMYLKVQTKELVDINSLSKLMQLYDNISIGRNPSNQLTFEDKSISRFHAFIEGKGDSYYLNDLGSIKGTFVKLIKNRPIQIVPGLQFVCGSTEFKVMRQIIEENRNIIQLMVASENQSSQMFELDLYQEQEYRCYIGTSHTCAVKAMDKDIESLHAKIFLNKTFAYLQNISLSGTWLRLSSQKERSGQFQLQDGQSFQIGPYILTPFFSF